MPISSALGSSALLPAGLGFRNKIINGGFDIWQRGTSSFTTNGAYTADRWVMNLTGTGTAQTVSQVAFTAGNPISNQEPAYHIRNAVTGGSGTSSLVVLTQKIEDVRTCAGQPVTVSFWAKVTSGTANLGLDLYQEFGSGGSATVFGIGAQKFALTTSWQRFTALINVSSISSKTIGTNNFLACRFWFSSGSDYNSLNNSLGIQSATFDIWGVQVEQNYQPTPFEQRPFAVEVSLCQRYFSKSFQLETAPVNGNGTGDNTGNNLVVWAPTVGNSYSAAIKFPVRMRRTPDITLYNAETSTPNTWSVYNSSGSINNSYSVVVGTRNEISVLVYATSITTITVSNGAWSASAEL